MSERPDPQPDPQHPEGIVLDDISVSFGATRALNGVTLTIAPGEVVGLMGHNGAGKSTLLNVATGALAPDSGRITVAGEEVHLPSTPRAFSDLGVMVIHQEPALAPNLSILDNLYLARPTRLRPAERSRRAAAMLADLGVTTDLSMPVSELSMGERQVVDLCRGLLHSGIRGLFLDEPTAALGNEDAQRLHDRIRKLSEAGTSVVYVSHRLPDILDVCSRIVVLQEGRVLMDAPRSSFTLKSLSESLAPGGTGVEPRSPDTVVTPRMSVRRDRDAFEFGSGEVVGLFGVAAGPQFSLMQELGGHRSPAAQATVTLDGSPYHAAGPIDAVKAGVHIVPADRERDGLLPNLSAVDNVFLPWLGMLLTKPTMGRSEVVSRYAKIRAQFQIAGPGGDAAITSFSGGNRQKHLLARWMSVVTPRVLLLEQPTQGVDEAAKADIRRAVRALVAEGVSVVVASAEADEIASMCDRVYVFRRSGVSELECGDEMEIRMLAELLDTEEQGAAE